jgi:Kdo2-lipid IVA lauroyltransferase/acyltransferase
MKKPAKVIDPDLIRDRISLGMQFLTKMTDTLVAIMLRFVLRYRLSVIKANLKSSFLYPNQRELNKDVRENYFFLAKILRQVLVKPRKRLLERKMHLSPFPSFDHWLQEGKSVIVTFGHTGNWEWTGSFLGVRYPDQVCALYKKIKSKSINTLMYNRRLSHVNYLIETKQMGELLRLMKKKPILILMISDQNPGSAQGIIWADFLGRKTAFVNGPETLALRYALPVVYVNALPGAEGGYELSCQEIYDGQEAIEPGIIMQRFANSLEKNIRECKSHWLWSHKRWKRTSQA